MTGTYLKVAGGTEGGAEALCTGRGHEGLAHEPYLRVACSHHEHIAWDLRQITSLLHHSLTLQSMPDKVGSNRLGI